MQLENALHTLGINALRPFQEEALNTLLTSRSLLTLMPTSAGKSLVFFQFCHGAGAPDDRHRTAPCARARPSSAAAGQGRCRRLPE